MTLHLRQYLAAVFGYKQRVLKLGAAATVYRQKRPAIVRTKYTVVTEGRDGLYGYSHAGS